MPAPERAVEWEAAALDAAVFEGLRAAERAGDRAVGRAYARAMEGAYVSAGALARRIHADGVNAEFAARLGLSRTIHEAIEAHQRVSAAARHVFVERARNARDEEANVRDARGAPSVILTLRPERFGDLAALARFLPHELAHLDDLLDPAFGRAPGFAWPGPSQSEKASQRDRYRALWCLSVDARLRASGRARATEAERREGLALAFRNAPPAVLDAVAAALGCACPAHARLLDAAVDPRALAALVPEGLAPAEAAALARTARRAVCPLCAFPTTEWSRPEEWTAAAAAEVRHPGRAWRPEDGACARCHECYELRAAEAARAPGGR